MTRDPGCVFCSMNPQFILEESEHALAVYTHDAIKPGHIIIAAKQHITSFEALADAQAADLFALARRTAARALPVLGAEKFYTVSIADLVPHFHLHLLPRMPGDPSVGPHIMGDTGWKAAAGSPVTSEQILDLIRKLKQPPRN